MNNNLEIYNQIGNFWWNPNNPLYQFNPIRFGYFNDIIGDLRGLKVLDVGCGGGLLSEEFAKKGAGVTGIDISEDSINVAKNHALESNLSIDYKVCSAESIIMNDNMFDVVVCADCLEHVDNLEKVIKEISRVLKISGKFCYLTMNRTIISRVTNWIVESYLKGRFKFSKMSGSNLDIHDWRKFIKPEELYQLMHKYEMKNIETKGVVFAGVRKGGVKLRIGENTKIAYIGYGEKY